MLLRHTAVNCSCHCGFRSGSRLKPMKLATLKDGTRDGQLAVVSSDLSLAHLADGIAPSLQRALDDWSFIEPQLAQLARDLAQGRAPRAFPFDPKRCMAPLPRAGQRLISCAYPHHLELLNQAQASQLHGDQRQEPAVYQSASDDFLGAHENMIFRNEALGIDFSAELAVIVDDVPMGANAAQSLQRVRLLMLANTWTLRLLIEDQLPGSSGFMQGIANTAFAPVAITPDEAQSDWREGRLHQRLSVHLNGRQVASPDTGTDMPLGFGELIAQAASHRSLRAGSILSTGTVSNRDAGTGWCSVAQARARQILEGTQAQTAYLKFGDRIRIQTSDAQGLSLFGSIEQQVIAHKA
jgi:fumarylacetoacetate (FAA) hydrolase